MYVSVEGENKEDRSKMNLKEPSMPNLARFLVKKHTTTTVCVCSLSNPLVSAPHSPGLHMQPCPDVYMGGDDLNSFLALQSLLRLSHFSCF